MTSCNGEIAVSTEKHLTLRSSIPYTGVSEMMACFSWMYTKILIVTVHWHGVATQVQLGEVFPPQKSTQMYLCGNV